MLGTDRDALLCDLAETYHIYAFDTVPLMTLATLCAGLHADSRINLMRMGATRVAPMFALVQMADTLTALKYELEGNKNAPLPPMLRDVMMGKQKNENKTAGFESIEAFEQARMRIIGHV